MLNYNQQIKIRIVVYTKPDSFNRLFSIEERWQFLSVTHYSMTHWSDDTSNKYFPIAIECIEREKYMCVRIWIKEKKTVRSSNIDTIQRNKKTYFSYAWNPDAMARREREKGKGWKNKWKRGKFILFSLTYARGRERNETSQIFAKGI